MGENANGTVWTLVPNKPKSPSKSCISDRTVQSREVSTNLLPQIDQGSYSLRLALQILFALKSQTNLFSGMKIPRIAILVNNRCE
jgi:hypothetical protein